MNNITRRKLFLSALAIAAATSVTLPVWDDAYAAYLPVTKPSWNALDYGVTGDGSTDDSAAINNLLTNANNAGAAIWFPGNKTYNVGSTQLVVPTGATVVASATATFLHSIDPGTNGTTWPSYYGSPTGAMISGGSNSSWTGGVFNSTAQLATSITSFTPTAPVNQVFILNASGLNIAVSNFIRLQSASNPASHLEGTVTAYSGTSLTVNVQFASGTTQNDWVVTAAGVWNAAYVLDNASNATLDLAQVKGTFYIGVILSGWNPSTGGSKITSQCKINRCYAFGIRNRPFYMYGTCNHNTFDTCIVDGNSNGTDYAFNMNPANATGTVNAQQFNSYINCRVINCGFQGFAVSDLSFYTTITSPIITSVSNSSSSGSGILIQAANNGGANQPQWTNVTNPTIRGCNTGIAIVGSLYANITGGSAIVCGTGFLVSPSGSFNSAECAWQDMLVQASTGVGVSISAGQTNTILSGRSVGNTGGNIVDNGSGTVKTNLITV